ncbi:hypothetical protein JZ751_016696 [Albula glossodonta]|uniref:Uncharacterized protein n=1 Tax=Albula glossodonta TaxID=121402 RepID=A0A8T2NQ38_9TELE|nr:hypothetical protein JZ751_016696 [Albula glossodonta]
MPCMDGGVTHTSLGHSGKMGGGGASQISRSSGGTLSMLSISNRAPATSCWLGLYVPSDCRFFRAVITMTIRPMTASNTQQQPSGTATTSQGMRSLCSHFCKVKTVKISL